LLHVSWDSVKDKSASGRSCGNHRLSQHVEDDLVGNEFAPVEILLNGNAEGSPPRHVIAEQFTGCDVRYVEMRGDQCALGSLSRARWGDHQYSHPASPQVRIPPMAAR